MAKQRLALTKLAETEYQAFERTGLMRCPRGKDGCFLYPHAVRYGEDGKVFSLVAVGDEFSYGKPVKNNKVIRLRNEWLTKEKPITWADFRIELDDLIDTVLVEKSVCENRKKLLESYARQAAKNEK